MEKDELLETLVGIKMTAVFGIVAKVFVQERLEEFIRNVGGRSLGLRTGEQNREGYGMQLDTLADVLSNDAGRKVLEQNMNLFMKQDLVRLTYEHIIYYCEEHSCFGQMKAQSWFLFARIIRNTLSHKTGSLLHRWPSDAPVSVTWRDHTISKADVGTDIVFGADEAFHLNDDMVGFARTLP